MIEIREGDNLKVTRAFPDESFSLIYIDPPFNTGRTQSREENSFDDRFDDFIGFLRPRLEEAYRLLTATGSFFLHLDYREVHYAKIELDKIFGRSCFMNEIIWAYDYGGRTKTRWPAKHDNILWYVKDPQNYCFNYDEVERIPYMAPSLCGEEKAARGKTLTDTWWHTIVSPTGKEKTGYPTQKPLGLMNRIVKVHSRPGDRLLDFFAGSGAFGEAAARNERHCVLVDVNPAAIQIMTKRLAFASPVVRAMDYRECVE